MTAFPKNFSAGAGMPRLPFSQAEGSTQASGSEPTRGTAGHPPTRECGTGSHGRRYPVSHRLNYGYP